jgi:hypothetical protein
VPPTPTPTPVPPTPTPVPPTPTPTPTPTLVTPQIACVSDGSTIICNITNSYPTGTSFFWNVDGTVYSPGGSSFSIPDDLQSHTFDAYASNTPDYLDSAVGAGAYP